VRRGSVWGEVGWLWLTGLLAGVFALRLRPVSAVVVTLILLGGYLAATFLAYAYWRYWAPVVLPLVSGFLVLLL